MKDKLEKLVNQKVTKSSSGGGAGSIFKIEFEDASYLFVFCSWRIQKGEKVIVTSEDTIIPSEYTSSPNGLIGEKVLLIEGKILSQIHLTPQYDLQMTFDEGYKIIIFCDIGYSSGNYDVNWEINLPERKICIEVTNNFDIRLSEENYN